MNNGICRLGQEGKRGIKEAREHGTPDVLKDIILCNRPINICVKCNLAAARKRGLGSPCVDSH